MHFKRTASLLIAVLLLFNLTGIAQDPSAVTWKATGKKTGEGQYQVEISGTVKAGWYIYAKPVKDAGIEDISLHFQDTSIQKKDSQQILGNLQKINDKVFGIPAEVIAGNFKLIQKIQVTGEVPATLKLTLIYNTAGNDAFIPEEVKIDVPMQGGVDMTATNRILIPTIDLEKPVNDCGGTESISGDLLRIFMIGFLGGLVALVTPCVFPMIPLTVSFFTKKALTKKQGVINASTYGFFIFLIYVLLSVPFYFIDSPEILNLISTNPWLNVIFFLVFIVFALSFFGLYEITLPSSISNRADAKSGTGNVIGIFFMALTLAIVSFSCTGPILGSLLVGSLTGGAVQLTAGMGGFGLALALPFALFALFPNWLNSLPKSGGWLNSVKVVLGFVEVGLAIKFLSNADLVVHWGLLKREVFIGIWILCGLGITLYLLGVLKFSTDDPMERPGKFRIFLAAVFAAFTLYLVPGVTNTEYANLKLISGFPPPLCYSVYDNPVNCRGFDPVKDYELAVIKARKENKPMLIDFTGYACVNCRRMEENVWTNEEIKSLITERFILVSLYVDDKKNLPASKQFTYTNREGIKKEIVTVGDKWATFETENFKNNAQPLYAILNGEERLMNKPVGYTPSIKEYKKWLLCGLEAFERSKK